MAVYTDLLDQYSPRSVAYVMEHQALFAEFEVVADEPEPEVVQETTHGFAVGDFVIALGEYAKIVTIQGRCISIQFGGTNKDGRRHDCDKRARFELGRFVDIDQISRV